MIIQKIHLVHLSERTGHIQSLPQSVSHSGQIIYFNHASGNRPPNLRRDSVSLRSTPPLPQSATSCFAELASCPTLNPDLKGRGTIRYLSGIVKMESPVNQWLLACFRLPQWPSEFLNASVTSETEGPRPKRSVSIRIFECKRNCLTTISLQEPHHM